MTGAWLLALLAGPVVAATAAAPDPRKHYVGHSVAGCEVIDYACPTGWPGFQDDHGCGCLAPPAAGSRTTKKKPAGRTRR